MILTIPYNPKTPGGYDKLSASILRHGRHPAHTLFVVSKEADEDAAFAFAMKVQNQFGRYFAVTVPDQRESMTRASNRLFVAALKALESYEPSETENAESVMLYFDPTWKICKPRWLDEFQAEYYIAGAPVTMGNFKGEKVTGPVAINRRFLKLTKLLSFLPDSTHWREFLAWELINNGLQSTAFGRILPAYIRPHNA